MLSNSISMKKAMKDFLSWLRKRRKLKEFSILIYIGQYEHWNMPWQAKVGSGYVALIIGDESNSKEYFSAEGFQLFFIAELSPPLSIKHTNGWRGDLDF